MDESKRRRAASRCSIGRQWRPAVAVWWLELWTLGAHLRYIPLYLAYFCFWGAHGLTLPLIPVFLQSKGISAGELAVLSFIAQILAFGSRLLAAVLADRTGRHKIITAVCLTCAALLLASLLFVPKRIAVVVAAFNFTNGTGTNTTMSTDSPTNISNATQSARPAPPLFEWHSDTSLWLAFVLRTLGFTIFNPVNSLMDAMAFNVIARVQSARPKPATAPAPAPFTVSFGATRNQPATEAHPDDEPNGLNGPPLPELQVQLLDPRVSAKQLDGLPTPNNLSGSEGEPSVRERDDTGASASASASATTENQLDSTPAAPTICTNSETLAAEVGGEKANGPAVAAACAAHNGHPETEMEPEAHNPLLQPSDNSKPVAGSTHNGLASDALINSCGKEEQRQREAEAATRAAAEKAAAQNQRVGAYGLVRAFGSLGYLATSGSAAIMTLVLAPNAPITQTFVFSVAASAMMWLVATVSYFFFRTQHIGAGPNLLRDVGKFVRDARILKIFALLFVEAILFGIIWGNLFMFFREIGGASMAFYTSILTFTVSELVVVSCFAHVLIAHIGFGGAQLIVLAAYLVRFAGYALIPCIWWKVPLDLLQGVTVGLHGVCMAGQMAALAPPAMQQSAQGLAQGVYYGLGLAFGYLIGGLGFQLLGARPLMWCGAGLAALALATFGGLHFWDVARQRRSHSQSQPENNHK